MKVNLDARGDAKHCFDCSLGEGRRDGGGWFVATLASLTLHNLLEGKTSFGLPQPRGTECARTARNVVH